MKLIDIFPEMPERRLSVNGAVSLHTPMFDEAVTILKRSMTNKLATTILDNEVFYKIEDKPYGLDVIHYRADVIVLTEEEFREICVKQFQAGKDSVLGPSPHNFYKF